MRLMIDSLVAIMLVMILAGVVLHVQQDRTRSAQSEEVRNNVRWIKREFQLKTVLKEVELNEHGHPLTVDPTWFEGKLPDNSLLGKGYPWMEIASAGQKDLAHPMNPVATDFSIAKFWYNPANGAVRARVPATISDEDALEMYNFINDCQLTTLFQH